MRISHLGGIALCGAIACSAVAWAVDDSATSTAPERASRAVPEGLSASDWSGICAARDENRHAVHALDGGGYQAWNPGQGWRTSFDGRGFLTTPDRASDGGDWSWGLELVSYGFEGHQRMVSRPVSVTAEGQRVAYDWDSTLTEWYVNDGRGLEHGYTVHERPSGGAGPLRMTLAVRGDLCAVVQNDGNDVRFVNAEGGAILNYTGLTVFDAGGAKVPARFETVSDGLLLTVDDREARYPLTIDPIAQQAYFKASNTGVDDDFGGSVAVSGDTVVVGAYREDGGATGVNGDQSSNSTPNAGAAYVFVRVGGVWSQQAYLKASNTEGGDEFGWSVAASGDTVVVGAIGEASNAIGVNGNQANNDFTQAGAAYVFVRVGGSWSQQAYLKASNTGTGDFFGISVAVSGNTVVVGAVDEDSAATSVNGNQTNNSAGGAGAAYVFVRISGVWSQQAYLKPSNTGGTDQFGTSVAISGNTVVVGAYQEDSDATGVNGSQANNSASDSGAAYVFIRVGSVWSQQAYLKASNTGLNDNFGWSVGVSADTVVIGAWSENSNATGVNGNQADNSAGQSGAAYVFVRSGTTWSQQAYLKASNTGADDRFGWSVAASGDTVVVGAYFEDSNAIGVDGNQTSNGTEDSGAAYLFVRNGGVWSQKAYLKASNTGSFDEFGKSVAVSGGTVVVGAHWDDSNATGVNGSQADGTTDSGAAYIFVVPPPIPGDINGDGVVDGADIAIVLGGWGPCAGCPADIDGDGVVDGADIAVVLGNWTG